MILVALVAHRRLHLIQAAEIFEQGAIDWIKALRNLPRATYLGARLVGLQESALEGESNKREANDDQCNTQSIHFAPPRTGILSRAAAAPNALFPLRLPEYRPAAECIGFWKEGRHYAENVSVKNPMGWNTVPPLHPNASLAPRQGCCKAAPPQEEGSKNDPAISERIGSQLIVRRRGGHEGCPS